MTTKDKLLQTAKELFWTRGYSNVSVRDITNATGVDAALVSRYFGGKQGLFEATLAEIGSWDALDVDRDELLDAAVSSFSHPFDPEKDQANPFSMLLANVIDPEMGDKIRELVQRAMADPLAKKLGGEKAEEQAAMLLASLFGMALMRKNFQLDVFRDKNTESVEAEHFHLARAALEYGD